ncbi:MAG TPA: hypothetical protein PK397_11680 [Ignavibacteriaceae bacterium]|nr:hypothetical protein [Ignavibacteriaceae bacterium]
MKFSRLFWGLFLVTLGGLFLIANVFGLQINLGEIYIYWPVILIIFGLSIFLKSELPKTILTGAAAILLGLIIFNLFIRPWGCVKKKTVCYTVMNDSVSYPYENSIQNVNLVLKGGAASYKIQSGTDSLFLLKGYDLSETVSYDVVNEPDYVKIVIESEDLKFKWDNEFTANEFLLRLNENPAYNFQFDIGAAEADFDLSLLKIKNLDFDIGAAKMYLKLGQPVDDTLYVDVEAGASSIKILFPDSLGGEVFSDLSLSSKNFSGFTKLEKNKYRTENFFDASKKIIFRISGGVAKIRIERY